MYWTIVVLCFLLIPSPELVNSSATDFYTAGVVEFSKFTSDVNGFDTRLEAFLTIINSTEAKSTDILVFPESALNDDSRLTFVPSEKDNITPCLQKSSGVQEYAAFLIELSCAASTAQKYLVVNIKEKEVCSETALINKDTRPCADNDLNIYNTNVVFDRTGRIISRYRKFNIYVETSNQTLVPDYSIFDTDFGVRFGHFICFDINFYEPTEMLVKRFGVKNFILPLHFASELPFLTAVQLEQAWAWANNVNLLAAGGSYPFTGATGSGIFSGKAGALTALMTGDFGVRKLLIAKIPKIPGQIAEPTQPSFKRAPQTKVALLIDPEIQNFESQLIDFSAETQISREVCSKGHCCHFNISTEPQAQTPDSIWYQYRIGVFNGRRTYKKRVYSDLTVCAVYACTNSSASSCGDIFRQPYANLQANFIFKSILIEGDFEHRDQMLLMPNSVDVTLYPLPADIAEWSVKDLGNTHRVSWKLTNAVNNLLSFGVYGNYYLKSAAAPQMIPSIYVLALILSLYLNFFEKLIGLKIIQDGF